MFLGMGGRSLTGLGTPNPTGLPPMGWFVDMIPGACCYDPARPSWYPSWLTTPAEDQCKSDTNNCSAAYIPVTPRPVSTCAGTLNADGTCTPVTGVNDPNATQGTTSANSAYSTPNTITDWINGMQTGATLDTSSGVNWLLIGGLALVLVVGLAGGTAAGRHLR